MMGRRARPTNHNDEQHNGFQRATRAGKCKNARIQHNDITPHLQQTYYLRRVLPHRQRAPPQKRRKLGVRRLPHREPRPQSAQVVAAVVWIVEALHDRARVCASRPAPCRRRSTPTPPGGPRTSSPRAAAGPTCAPSPRARSRSRARPPGARATACVSGAPW